MKTMFDPAEAVGSPTWVQLPGTVNAYARRLNRTTVLIAPHVPAKRYWLVTANDSGLPIRREAFDLDLASLAALDQWIAQAWSTLHEKEWGALLTN